MTRRLATAGRRILDGCAVLIVAAGLALAIHSHLATDLIVRSGSMAPAVPVGALVTVEGIARDELRPGMVVTVAEGPGILVTHRVHRVVDHEGQLYLELKGDANRTPDPVLVPATAVVGRVTAVVPYLGFGLAALSMPAGQLTLLAVVALLVACGWLLEDLAAGAQPAVPAARTRTRHVPT